jgi:hypothetical protein
MGPRSSVSPRVPAGSQAAPLETRQVIRPVEAEAQLFPQEPARVAAPPVPCAARAIFSNSPTDGLRNPFSTRYIVFGATPTLRASAVCGIPSSSRTCRTLFPTSIGFVYTSTRPCRFWAVCPSSVTPITGVACDTLHGGVGGRRSWLSAPRRLPGQLREAPCPPPYIEAGGDESAMNLEQRALFPELVDEYTRRALP